MSQIKVELLNAEQWARARELRLASLRDSAHAFGGNLEAESTYDESAWREKFTIFTAVIAKVDGVDVGFMSVENIQGDFVSMNEIIKYDLNNSDSDIYIQYSQSEGFCNAVLEAQSMGVLPIVSNAEGLSENVLNNKTGWVIEKNSPNLLAEKIVEVINLPESNKEKIRKQAIERIKKEFNIEKQQKEFIDFYTQ